MILMTTVQCSFSQPHNYMESIVQYVLLIVRPMPPVKEGLRVSSRAILAGTIRNSNHFIGHSVPSKPIDSFPLYYVVFYFSVGSNILCPRLVRAAGRSRVRYVRR